MRVNILVESPYVYSLCAYLYSIICTLYYKISISHKLKLKNKYSEEIIYDGGLLKLTREL